MKKRKPIIAQSTTAALLVLAALALPGCVSSDLTADDDIRAPVHASDKYQITYVKNGTSTLDVSTKNATLNYYQKNDIRLFLYASRQMKAKKLSVEAPSSNVNSIAVATEIANIMIEEGVQRDNVVYHEYRGGPQAPVRIKYDADGAWRRHCGDWSKDLADTSDNTSYPNLGCAVQYNLAAMIANPSTLVVPTAVTPKLSEADVGAAIRADTFVSTVDSQSLQKYKSSP